MQKQTVDLYWTQEGDFLIENNKLVDTRVSSYRNLIQRVLKRIASAKGDWALDRDEGSRLGEFFGRPNNATTGIDLKTMIMSELRRESLLNANEFNVEVVPVSKHSVVVLLAVFPKDSSQAIKLSINYSFADNKMIPRGV